MIKRRYYDDFAFMLLKRIKLKKSESRFILKVTLSLEVEVVT